VNLIRFTCRLPIELFLFCELHLLRPFISHRIAYSVITAHNLSQQSSVTTETHFVSGYHT